MHNNQAHLNDCCLKFVDGSEAKITMDFDGALAEADAEAEIYLQPCS